MMPPFRVVIADKQKLFFQLIRKTIEDIPDMAVIGDIDSGLNLLGLLNKTAADLLVIGAENLQDMDQVRDIKTTYPNIRILIITEENSKAFLLQAIYAGVDGFLLTESSYSELLSSLNTIRDGRKYFCSLSSEKMADIIRTDMRPKIIKGLLSEKEISVLKLRCKGYSLKEVGDLLSLSANTIENHLYRIKKKLNIRSKSELMQFAVKQGYLS